MQPTTRNESSKHRHFLRWNGRMRTILSLLLVLGVMVPLWAIVFAIGTNFAQCEVQTNGTCTWINGMDAVFLEGEAIPQRAVFDGLTTATTVHSYTWSVTWNDRNWQHGYDFLVSFDQARVLHQTYAGQMLDLNYCGTSSGGTEATCYALRNASTPYTYTVSIPDDTYVSGSYTRDGNTSSRIQAFESRFGDRTMQLWANAVITDAHLELYHAEDSTGFPQIANGADATYSSGTVVRYTLWFTTTATQFMVEYAGHLALTGDPYVDPISWGYEAAYGGLGAAGLYPGGMWHVKDHEVDNGIYGNIGSQDNQSRVRAPYLFPLESSAHNSGVNTSATDMVTLTTSINDAITGTFSFYLCADTTRPYTDALTHGCTQTTSGSGFGVNYIGAVSVTFSANKKQATATSPAYTPTLNGQYCYLTIFTPTVSGGGYSAYGPTWDSEYPSECFLIDSPTAVRLSSFRGVSGSDVMSLAGFSLPLLFIGLCGIVGGFGLYRLACRRS